MKKTQHAAPRKLHFTVKEIKDLPIPVGVDRYYVYDTQVTGLALRVSKTASKTFVLYRKIQGVPQRITLGRFPEVSLNAARQKAVELNAAIAERESRKGHCIDTPTEAVLKKLFDKVREEQLAAAMPSAGEQSPVDQVVAERSDKVITGAAAPAKEESDSDDSSAGCNADMQPDDENLAEVASVDLPVAGKPGGPMLPVAKFIERLNHKITDSWFDHSPPKVAPVQTETSPTPAVDTEAHLIAKPIARSSGVSTPADRGPVIDALKERLPFTFKGLLGQKTPTPGEHSQSEFAAYFARLKRALGQDNPEKNRNPE